MQRRAAAAYVAIFVLVAAGSYGLVATTQAPPVTLQQSEVDAAATAGGTVTVDGTSYSVAEIKRTGGGGGGHGGGAAATTQATFEWNVTVEETGAIKDGATLNGTKYGFLQNGTTYAVQVEGGDDPASFALVEQFSVDRPTVTQDGTTYVVLEGAGDNRTLVPREEYVENNFPEPATVTFAEGDAWNETHTVGNVTGKQVVLVTSVTETKSKSVTEGGNVTLSGTTFTAHFPSKSKVQLTTNYGAYSAEVAAVERYHDRINGLWIVAILSSLTGVLLLALAYLPNKDL